MPVDQLPGQEQLPAAPLVAAAYGVAWAAVLIYLFSIWRRLGDGRARDGRGRRAGSRHEARDMIEGMTSAHFIFIPAVLLLGIVIGWILGSAPRATPTRWS